MNLLIFRLLAQLKIEKIIIFKIKYSLGNERQFMTYTFRENNWNNFSSCYHLLLNPDPRVSSQEETFLLAASFESIKNEKRIIIFMLLFMLIQNRFGNN